MRVLVVKSVQLFGWDVSACDCHRVLKGKLRDVMHRLHPLISCILPPTSNLNLTIKKMGFKVNCPRPGHPDCRRASSEWRHYGGCLFVWMTQASLFWQKTSHWLDLIVFVAVYYDKPHTNVIIIQSMLTVALTYKPHSITSNGSRRSTFPTLRHELPHMLWDADCWSEQEKKEPD